MPPPTPYAQLLVAVNGGAPQSGGIDVPSAATLQFSAESTVGWRQQRWELYDYPEGFATPAGWTLAADGTIYSTDVTPSLVTLPANTDLWGGWAPRLKINEAVDDDATTVPNLVDETTALMMLSPSGQRDVFAGETTQFTTATTRHKRWLRTQQRNARVVEGKLGTATVADDIAKSGGTTIDRVQGIRGRAIVATAPRVGDHYAFDGTSHVPLRRTMHVDLFGAVADSPLDGTGTDCADAFEAAIKELDTYGGGIVEVGYTGPGIGYRLSRTVNVTRNVRIKGHGGAISWPGSIVVADAGVTAFRLHSAQSTPDGDGAADSVFEGLSVLAAGRLATSTTGAYVSESTAVTVTSAGDFVNGQLVAIEGAAPPTTLAETTADTTSASATVVFASTGDQIPVLRAGQYIIVGTAYPAPTKILSVNNNNPLTVTMASAAATSLTGSPVKYCPALVTRIVSGGGTTSWVIDSTDSGTSMATATIKHADSAFDVLVRATIAHVNVGDAQGHHFAGAGFALRGSHAYVPTTNLNLASISDCTSYANRWAVYAIGPDANACRIHVSSLQTTDFAFSDLSLLGNKYSACHADGGQGYLTAEHAGNASNFSGCYAEGGTFSSFGGGVTVTGGTMPVFAGGSKFGPVCGAFAIGGMSISKHTTYHEPRTSFARYQSSTATNGGLSITAVEPSLSRTGFFVWTHANGFRAHPIAIADTDAGSNLLVGSLWFPSGFLLGDDPGNGRAMTVASASRFVSLRSSATLGAVTACPQAGVHDTGAAYGVTTTYWKRGDFIVDPELLDGCPSRHVIEDGRRAGEWQASTAYVQYSLVCPTVGNHNGSMYQAAGASDGGTSDATEPDWTTAPAPGNTVVDGGCLWTNVGAAAYTQPVELDGYIVHGITTSETWAQGARHFNCGSVEVTGSISADATLTLPKGRYRRWFWNHTTGGFALLVKCATGATVRIPPGYAAEVQCDGASMRARSEPVSQDTSLGGQVATTDATPAYRTLATLAVGEVRAIDVLAKVCDATGAVRQSFKLAAIVYGAAGPTATLDAAPDSTAKGTGTAVVTIDVTGATARLKITGIAATNLTTTYEVHVL